MAAADARVRSGPGHPIPSFPLTQSSARRARWIRRSIDASRQRASEPNRTGKLAKGLRRPRRVRRSRRAHRSNPAPDWPRGDHAPPPRTCGMRAPKQPASEMPGLSRAPASWVFGEHHRGRLRGMSRAVASAVPSASSLWRLSCHTRDVSAPRYVRPRDSHPRRERLRRFFRIRGDEALEWLESSGSVNVNDRVELPREYDAKVVTHTLGFGSVDDANRAL
jgi:hypothetical protein